MKNLQKHKDIINCLSVRPIINLQEGDHIYNPISKLAALYLKKIPLRRYVKT